MINIELRLMAKMLYDGNFKPLLTGDITEESMITEQGKILLSFIMGYRHSTDESARYPSLSVVQSRFANSGIEIPNPAPGDTVEALVFEVQTQKMRSRISEIALELDLLSRSPDNLTAPLLAKQIEIRKMTDKLQRAQHIGLADGFDDILADYDIGNILSQGIPWPWPSLNSATKGIHKGEFTIFAGRPKSRKTFTALSVGVHAFMHGNARVLIFSPEMKRRLLLLRVIAFVGKLRYAEFKNAALNELEQAQLLEEARKYGKLPNESDEAYAFRLHETVKGLAPGQIPCIDIVESTGRSVAWMESQIEIFQPDVVIADSFYRQNANTAKSGDADWKAMSALSRNLKDLTMKTNVALIGTHQMNRGAEGKVGTISSMGYADAFGQDMDNGFHVITGKVNGADVSALKLIGGREVPFSGLLIRNVPCCDFTEIGPITNDKMILDLLKQEDEEAAKEEAEDQRQKVEQPMGTKRALHKAGEAAAKRVSLLTNQSNEFGPAKGE